MMMMMMMMVTLISLAFCTRDIMSGGVMS